MLHVDEAPFGLKVATSSKDYEVVPVPEEEEEEEDEEGANLFDDLGDMEFTEGADAAYKSIHKPAPKKKGGPKTNPLDCMPQDSDGAKDGDGTIDDKDEPEDEELDSQEGQDDKDFAHGQLNADGC